MVAMLDPLLTKQGEELAGIRRELGDAVTVLADTTSWIMRARRRRRPRRPRRRHALPADVLAGHRRVATWPSRPWRPSATSTAGDGDADFYAARITTAKFFCEQILPQVRGCRAPWRPATSPSTRSRTSPPSTADVDAPAARWRAAIGDLTRALACPGDPLDGAGHHPEPGLQPDRAGAAAPAHVRAHDRPRRDRRRVSWPAAAGPSAAATPRTSTPSPSGPCRRGSSAPGSTTWPPTGTGTSPTAPSRRCTSGRAASASRGASPWGSSPGCGSPAASASGCPAPCDAVAPAIPLAQAIGRLGNWWNQELFGGPTSLPWGLEISDRTAVGQRLPGRHHLPPHVPLRGAVEPGAWSRC